MNKNTKWSIWIADLDPVVGSEQGKRRPIVIVSESEINELLPVVNVLPITSRKPNRKIYPNEVVLEVEYGLTNESIVLCYQIRTLDKSRLIRYIGTIQNTILQNEIIEAIKFQLGID